MKRIFNLILELIGNISLIIKGLILTYAAKAVYQGYRPWMPDIGTVKCSWLEITCGVAGTYITCYAIVSALYSDSREKPLDAE